MSHQVLYLMLKFYNFGGFDMDDESRSVSVECSV